MNKRRLRNNGTRPKAMFGIGESAAILAAAGINAATQMAAAGINSAAAKESARTQAQASIQSAQRQAEALKDQSEKSKELQTESQEFIKEENAENREMQKDIQLQLQMLTGQQNVNDRLEASKIKVKAGGRLNRRLRNGGVQQSSLRGGNMPFVVTDGGGVIPIGRTPEGYDIYEIYGNDHEHYHKAQGGKYKSGVGIKFSNGGTVEGEGNQNSKTGEILTVTPNDAYFISDHKINGNNPADLVRAGMHPLQAYAIQENNKAVLGINDDGTKRAKLGKRKFLAGGTPVLYNMNDMNMLNYSSDTIGDTATGVAYGSLKDKEEFKYGGKKRCLRNGGRVKAKLGDSNQYAGSLRRQYAKYNNTDGNSGASGGAQPKQNFWGKVGNWVNKNADWAAAGINGLANIGGAFITAAGNRAADNILSEGYARSAKIMSDAYNSLRTIDPNLVNKQDYRAGHMMAALQAPVSQAANPLAQVDRLTQRRLRNAGRYSASGAAFQDRAKDIEIEGQDMANRIYAADQQQMQEIRKGNVDRLTDASRMNAYLDTQANQQYGQDRLKLLQYNNDIENQKILGSAGAESEGNLNIATSNANTRQANSQIWGSTIAALGQTGANTMSTMAKRRADLNNVLLGASTEAQVRYLGLNGTDKDKQMYKDKFQAGIDSGKLSKEDTAMYKRYIKWLS